MGLGTFARLAVAMAALVLVMPTVVSGMVPVDRGAVWGLGTVATDRAGTASPVRVTKKKRPRNDGLPFKWRGEGQYWLKEDGVTTVVNSHLVFLLRTGYRKEGPARIYEYFVDK